MDENVEQLDLALELDAPLQRRCEELLARYAWAGTCSYHTQTTLTATGTCEMCDLDALYANEAPGGSSWRRPVAAMAFTTGRSES